jgi:hypothetical protein
LPVQPASPLVERMLSGLSCVVEEKKDQSGGDL